MWPSRNRVVCQHGCPFICRRGGESNPDAEHKMSKDKIKTTEELEREFQNVMSCQAITELTRGVQVNSGQEIDEQVLYDRVEEYAPEMHKLLDSIFKTKTDG